MIEELICDICGKRAKSAAGLSGHKQLAHSSAKASLSGSPEVPLSQGLTALKASYDSLAERISVLAKDLASTDKVTQVTGGKAMDNVLTEKDMRVHELEGELKAAKEEAAAAAKETAEAKAAVEAAANEAIKAASQMPSFDEFLNHCQSCNEHRPQLENYNKNLLSGFVKNSTKETVIEMAKLKALTLGDFLMGKDGKIKLSGIPKEAGPYISALLNVKI